jgi:hypothetical protein
MISSLSVVREIIVRIFATSPVYVIQTGCGAHPASIPLGTGGPFHCDKAAGT